MSSFWLATEPGKRFQALHFVFSCSRQVLLSLFFKAETFRNITNELEFVIWRVIKWSTKNSSHLAHKWYELSKILFPEPRWKFKNVLGRQRQNQSKLLIWRLLCWFCAYYNTTDYGTLEEDLEVTNSMYYFRFYFNLASFFSRLKSISDCFNALPNVFMKT